MNVFEKFVHATSAILAWATLVLVFGCKNRKNDVFPAVNFIKSQVARVDSSAVSIIKLVPHTDSTYDTMQINKRDFRQLANDFLETPDISRKFSGKYTEERMMNNDLGLAVFIATPSDTNLEVRRQEVRIVPGPPDTVQSIYIEKFSMNEDSSVIKRMTWYVDQRFQVVTISQKKNNDEKTTVVEVAWKNNDQR